MEELTTMRDPRRARNIRTGLLLAAVAASFFVLILLKYGWYGR
ncbi:MAG TPA: cytochrome oxidase small assembly protein [Rhodocyclaceae bacterium]|nr:cytochrome oxidase small assembly protein [Rhodocyclaceae bacterium]